MEYKTCAGAATPYGTRERIYLKIPHFKEDVK